jgi:hypothetical protein
MIEISVVGVSFGAFVGKREKAFPFPVNVNADISRNPDAGVYLDIR